MTSDIFVIGGGVNGCGIARDAAGRGLSVELAEQGDLAQATSSASTKLFHGGLRYLEYYEFRLVREALRERETLLVAMPHISWPLRFVLPHHKGLRPAWMLRLGLFLYDHLGGRKILPPSRSLDLTRDPAGVPLKPEFTRGFEYSDCWVEDSRLVVLNARDAARRGAVIRTRTRVEAARRENGLWRVTLRDMTSGETFERSARILVNAAGPWVADVIGAKAGLVTSDRIRLVRGSHIVTRKLFDHDRPYIFQNADGRVLFAIPYEQDFTLIGTTDADHEGDPGAAECTPAERDYLLAAVSEYFRNPVTREDVVWSYSGVRPLYDDGASSATAATRDYVLKVEGGKDGEAPMLNVFGGKITTYRKLAEAAMARLVPWTGAKRAWTARAPLPGGDFPWDGAPALAAELRAAHPFLTERWAMRLTRAYGTEARALLAGAERAEDMGRDFGATLTEREVRWLMDKEWARTADDVLWRRSKLGLRLDEAEARALDAWMRANAPAPAPAHAEGEGR
ncbi:glycerol-3-phosphate dehydrogenase [Oceanicella actignis]|uniref:Glycerol-3-phosphate dehydrogenase n=1 Tax=Oceanicella actignis TaxID=1189325 RepID=A0A1M7SF12_9RHOB|nr:glycerol-3-phosphate dehydrogenase [Oceanicella actignis]SET23025.1 homodimeric glycerol 3-phosphate dehydrogenase (quinone) [Oceanicella actignis]SHN57040.1 glycerol-3-phosphate dehydrogenase [Oceanicella actignis]